MIYIILSVITLLCIFVFIFIQDLLLYKTTKQYNELSKSYDELLVKYNNSLSDLINRNDQIMSNLNIMKSLLECETIEESNKILEEYIINNKN